MLTPRYIFANDFEEFYPYFLSQPHKRKTFHKGEYLWTPGSLCEKIHYIISGAAIHYADHENGRRKIISIHAAGTVYPGYHLTDYKIELLLTTVALSDMEVLEFTIEEFQQMFESNTALSEQVVNWYSMYVNRFLFESIHQEYNSSLIKICNLLYILNATQTSLHTLTIEITQDEIAEMLGLSRVQLTRGLSELRKRGIIATSRRKIKVIDLPALKELCTAEAL